MAKTNIVIVLGLPGSGKSYFASRLAEMLNAEYVNSDRLRKELFPKRTYSKSEKAQVYDALLKKMQTAIAQKNYVVLDATFHNRAIREPFIGSGEDHIVFIEVQADETIIRERLQEDRPYSEADLTVYKLIKRQWEPLKRPHLTLRSTNDNIDAMLKRALQYLKDDTRSDR